MSRSISSKHALEPEEIDFCKRFVSFGEANYTEAYRRSHLKRVKGGKFVLRADYNIASKDEDRKALKPMTPNEVNRRGKLLLEQDYIQAYISEIKDSASDTARAVLEEQAKFGDDATARRAAEEIFKQEDKLGFRDAVMQWKDVLIEVGAVIRKPTICPKCDHVFEEEIAMEEMFNADP